MFNRKVAEADLCELAAVLDCLAVPFFLIQGTALGAYRDGGFVPNEQDVDVGVLHEHLRPFSMASAFTCRGYDVELVCAPFKRPRTLVVHMTGCKVDIVGFMRHGGKRFAASPVRSWLKDPYCIVHEAHVLEEYTRVRLFGRDFNAPSPIEQYLRLEYGADWRIPKEDHVSRTRVYDYLAREGVPLE